MIDPTVLAPGRTSDRDNVRRSFLWSDGWADSTADKKRRKNFILGSPFSVPNLPRPRKQARHLRLFAKKTRPNKALVEFRKSWCTSQPLSQFTKFNLFRSTRDHLHNLVLDDSENDQFTA